jgi:hypothetical protein
MHVVTRSNLVVHGKMVLLCVVLTEFVLFVVLANLSVAEGQHFSLLAQSFLEGKLYYTSVPAYFSFDVVVYKGHYFWPLGPFPAVVLMPFVAVWSLFHEFFYQVYLQIPLVALTGYLVNAIARKEGFSRGDALCWVLAFLVGGVYVGVAGMSGSWYFAQVVTVLLVWLSLWEFMGKKRWWLIGAIMGAVFLSRVTAALGLLFFILDVVWLENGTPRQKTGKLGQLFWPVVTAVVVWGLYNYFRFGDPLEQGYKLQLLGYAPLREARDRYGLESLAHLPGNLYYLFFAAPVPVFRDAVTHVLKFPYLQVDVWGLGIFFTSPYLLYMYELNYRNKLAQAVWLAVGFTAIPVLLYYGIGARQFGYRYALDFLPFVYFLFMRSYQQKWGKLSPRFKLLVGLSALFNMYLFTVYLIRLPATVPSTGYARTTKPQSTQILSSADVLLRLLSRDSS